MKKLLFPLCAALGLTACSQSPSNIADRTQSPCGDKPNCVSTQDTRDEFSIKPFELTAKADLNKIEAVALTIPRSKTAAKTEDYLRIEYTSKIMRFVDDLELKITDGKLLVRSESRTGRSDFGVNRGRVDELRMKLVESDLIQK